MTYPPQQGQPQSGYPGQPGPYGPPQKNRAPVIATMIFLVAVLAGVGVLGFVAPGFFLGDDDKGSSADGGGGDGGGEDGGGKSAGGPGGLPGGDSDGGVADGPADPTLSDDSGDSADSGPASGPASGPDSGGGSGGDAEKGEAFVKQFVTALNDLDSTTANSMYCPDAVGGMVDYVIKKNPELVVDSSDSTKYYLKVKLAGTLGGEPLSSGKISVELQGGNAPCVFTFTAG